MRVGTLLSLVASAVVFLSCEAPEEDSGLGTVDLAGDVRRTVILIYGETAPGQDMFVRGGLDHERARELLGLDCTPENFLCAIPISHRNARNPTTSPWKQGDTVLDWYGPEDGQTGTSHGMIAQGTAVDWTTNVWPAEWGPVRRVSVDGYGLEELNHVGTHYWMLDVDMDCSRGFPSGGASWFEVKSYIAGGAGWEPDVHQPGAPYATGNHFAQCGKLNVFRRGVDSARIYRLDQPPPPSMAFVALGDTGKGSSGQWDVARAMESFCRHNGCDFALLLGDNIYDSGASSPTDPQFQRVFEQPYANLRMPFYPVLGNHDYGGGGRGDEFWKGGNEVAYSQHSSKWRMPAAYHHWRSDNVEIFALDTNMQMWARDQQQRQDVRGWLQASNATWKIAFGHHPYYSNGGHGNAGSYEGQTGVFPWSGEGVKSFMDTVVCGRADLLLSGHDHSRQWMTDTCGGKTELVVSGAGGSASSLPGHDATRFQSAQTGFLYLAVEGNTLTASFVDAGGQVNFSRTLRK